MKIFDILSLLIFCSGLFIFINTFFLKLPSSIGLMVLALALSLGVLAFSLAFPEYHLAQHVKKYDFSDVMYRFVLSVMLFAAALKIDFRKLGSQLIPVLILSFYGVMISTLVIGGLMFFILDLTGIGISFISCLVFGALISSTDPIAITKTIKQYDLSKKLETKISGESLLNGGIAIVLAFTLVNVQQEAVSHGVLSTWDISLIFLRDIIGGLVVGVLFGWLGFKLLKLVDNHVVEAEVLITLALVMMGSYLGDSLSVSSMMVAVLTGLIIGNYGRSETGESAVGEYVYKFWRLIEETLAAMLFVLIGFEMLVIPLRLDYFALGFFAVIIVIFARWLSVFIPIKLMSMSHTFDKGTISVLSWGAIRGGLPVAFTLSLAPGFEGKEIIVTLTYVVVVCSILYQGLSTATLMKRYEANNARKSKLSST
ncbi:sodium:proton antiporter [Ekhidna sp.]|uniref:cation:proton antiporter n=1 Tax=Ekhidna sp. TaxID=2608089 RepID=UPI00329A2D56